MKNRQSVRAREYTYLVNFEPAEEGGDVVTCPALPGLVTEGDSLDEARQRAAEAIVGYLESLEKDGLPIPASEEHEVEPIRGEVTVSLKTA